MRLKILQDTAGHATVATTVDVVLVTFDASLTTRRARGQIIS
jgi:hypothetical protein